MSNRPDWLDQTPQVATEADCHALWSGSKDGKYFRCYLCGHRFQVGDTWRWVYAEGKPNLLVCASCDGPAVKERWDTMREEARTRFWWFTLRDEG